MREIQLDTGTNTHLICGDIPPFGPHWIIHTLCRIQTVLMGLDNDYDSEQ